MDLDSLKGKTVDDAVLDALKKHVGEFSTRAETAEEKARKAAKESIDGRKGKDAAIAKALEKLGIDSIEELDDLPGAKGQADALKQFEAKLKRAERELGEKSKALDELGGKYSAERRERAIAEQVAKHPFVDADDVRALIGARIKQEGDDLLFSGDGGKLVPLADGVAWMAKTKLHLIKPAGDGGKGSPAGRRQPDGSTKTMPRSEFDALDPAARVAAVKGGVTLTD